jgi:hypothetical protein
MDGFVLGLIRSEQRLTTLLLHRSVAHGRLCRGPITAASWSCHHESSMQAKGYAGTYLLLRTPPARSTVKHFSKNTDFAFFIQAVAAASFSSQLVHHSSYCSTFVPTLVTVRLGPSNGGQTTVWISLPFLITTMRRFTNPPVLGWRSMVPVQSALT